ncbi:N-acetylmuramoyl-L-alanine amidase [Pollutibacter soli]|uniref:N-acetylmuramoyl-L-alanine amidase n=1 Tax=Pollutibacter soli TaxID=3034157 RepID=UPI003013D840
MIAFAYYLLKVIICSGILYGYYLLSLRNKAFHYWNRFYLLCTVLLSVTLPLIKIKVNTQNESSSITSIPLVRVVNTGDAYIENYHAPAARHVELTDLASLGYGIISMGMLLAFLFTLWQIRNMIKRYEIIPMDGMSFLNTSEKGTPFSFLKYIFWNREIPADSISGKQILLHEIAHVRQKHSYDKLLMQCVLIVFWTNPFFWLIRKEIGMIHEFIADREAVRDQDTAAFAAMILQAAFPKQSFSLGSYFFHSPIKRRLKMLIKSNKPARSYFNRVMVLPILFIIVAGFTLKTKETHDLQLNKIYTVVIDAGHGGEDKGATAEGINEKDLNLGIAKRIKALNHDANLNIVLTRETDIFNDVRQKVKASAAANPDVFMSIHIASAPASNVKGFQVYVSENKNSFHNSNLALASAVKEEVKPFSKTPVEILSRKQKSIHVLDAPEVNYPAVLVECGFITNPEDRSLLSSSEDLDKIAKSLLNAAKKFLINQQNAGVVYSETDPEQDVAAYFDAAKKHGPALPETNDTIKVTADSIVIHRPVTGQDGITKDATPVAFYARKMLIVENDTLPKGVKSVDVTEKGDVIVIFNNGKAERMSFEEAHKKGFVPPAVLDKKSNTIQINPTTRIRGVSSGPLIVLNGVVLKKGTDIKSLDQLINPEDIKELQVLKDASASALYGDDAKDGVILITTINKSDSSFYTKPDENSVQELNKVFVKVEKPASFPGGESALNQYLFKELNEKDEQTKRTLAGTAKIRFVVNTIGAIEDLTILSGDNELTATLSHLVESGPKWIPAVQNGKNVSTYYILQFSYPTIVGKK